MVLKFLTIQPVGWDFARAMAFFNANVSNSSLMHATWKEHLFAKNKEKLISAISSLITKEGDEDSIHGRELEQQFHAMRNE